MYEVTDDYLNALTTSHRTDARLTCTPLSGDPVTLLVQSGSVTATYQQGTRRTGSLTVYATGSLPDGASMPGRDVANLLKRAGVTCLLEAGIGSNALPLTMIPLMTGTPSGVSWRVGDGMIDLSLADDWWRVAQGRFTGPWTPAAGLQRTTAVEQLMQQVAPGRQTVDVASDSGTIMSQGDWGVDRDTAIGTLCTDGGFDAYFDREGRIHVEDSKTASGTPVWQLLSGDGGVLETVETGLDATRLYNTVVVKPSATDNSQTWSPQVARLQSGDRAPANLGVTIPFFIASPTIRTANDALMVAQRRLDYVTGTTETLQADAVGNPALDEGDVIQILIPDSQGGTATMWDYYVDTITWDLVTGGMTVKARNQGKVTEDANA